jgi:hypothetical protein
MIEYGPLEVAEGKMMGDTDPGLAQAVQDVTEGLAATAAANAQSQAESHTFIAENGAQVIGGHTPVNSPTGAFMTPYAPVAAMEEVSTGSVEAQSEAFTGDYVSEGSPEPTPEFDAGS